MDDSLPSIELGFMISEVVPHNGARLGTELTVAVGSPGSTSLRSSGPLSGASSDDSDDMLLSKGTAP